ncbi:MAG: DNA-binding protein [Burkholderiales bacterium]|nr:DNA-binding protein [Burkholderiales bacterium]
MKIEVVRLKPGDDLRVELEKLSLPAGCVISGIGSLGQAVLRFAAQDEGTVVPGPLEVLSLAGTLGSGGVHLHASVSDAQGKVTGGHVLAGCVVRTTAEIVVWVLDDRVVARHQDYDYP